MNSTEDVRILEMPTDKAKATVVLDHEDYEELKKWAKEENRSVSNLLATIAQQALASRRRQRLATQEIEGNL